MNLKNRIPQELLNQLIGRGINILKKDNGKSELTSNGGLTLDYSNTADEIASLYDCNNEEVKG